MDAIAYKMFKVKKSKPGKLFPLYVMTNKATPMHIWLDAEEGERTENGKVRSKMGELAYRPGWHCSELPYATHIGVKDKEGNIIMQHSDTVWCVVRYSTDVDYQELCETRSRQMHGGKFVERDACLDYIPKNGYYRYRTSPQMFGKWIIAGRIMVECVLDDREVEKIVYQAGLEAMPREGGRMDLKKFGFEI